jgi:hypothetical protein
MTDEPIFATVPRKKPGPRKGWKKLPPPVMEEREEGHCPGCKQPTVPISFEVVKELVKIARDRGPEGAEHDLLYLAARLDGYCSLTCWRKTQ